MKTVFVKLSELSVKFLWTRYEKEVLKDTNVDLVKRLELKKAFYAGIHVYMNIITALCKSSIPEELGASIVDAMRTELLDFAKSQGAPDITNN